MDDGLCEAAIVNELLWKNAIGGAYSKPETDPRYASHPAGAARYHCDTKVRLPAVYFSMDLALCTTLLKRHIRMWPAYIAATTGPSDIV